MSRLLLRALVAAMAVGLVPMAMAQPPGDDAPQRLIVSFDALPPGLQANDHYAGAKVLATDETLGFAVVQASHGRAFREDAAKRHEVRGVEVDAVAEALGFTPNDPRFGSQYAPKLIGAPAAWSTTRGNSAGTLCLLDTGVRMSHQDLSANYRGGIDVVNGDNDPRDDGGHGTRTAGVAAATINNGIGIAGVANVPFKEVKVLSSTGSGYNSGIASGIRWCADNGARVVSMSFGSTTANTAVRDAVDYAWGKGLLLVAGSGNGGCADCVLYPAAFPNVIAVGSLDANRALSPTTSRGPQLDLAAPGVNVLTTGHGSDADYRTGGGTSIAAPHVAGAAALVWSAHPTWTNQQVRTALVATAQDVGASGWDTGAGNGLVRPDRAIAYGSAPTTSTTTTTSASGFTATFTPKSVGNDWWVETAVSANAPIAKVEAKVGNGAYVVLPKTDWGTYAKSVYAPNGSLVTFRATSTGGGVSMRTVTWT